MTPRYALYAAPSPETPLWRFGSALLGYDAATGEDVPFPETLPTDPAEWRALTEAPRRYGFHATLKAPFALAEGMREEDLLAAARAFARETAAIEVAALEARLLGPFVALVPAETTPPLDALAAACVRAFEPFRAPLTPADRARRLAGAALTPRQIAGIDAWGYPHVFEDFRFHMTLTGALPPERREPVRAALAAAHAALAPGLPIDAVAVFRQERRDGRFRIVERCPLAGQGRAE